MRRGVLLSFLAIILVVLGIPNAQAEFYVYANKSSYQVGDKVIVYFATNGGRLSLTLEGPYRKNMNLGDVPAGGYSLTIGQAEPRDVGSWKMTLTVEVCGNSCMLYGSGSGPFSTSSYFNVLSNPVPEFSAPILILGIMVAFTTLMTKRFSALRRSENTANQEMIS